ATSGPPSRWAGTMPRTTGLPSARLTRTRSPVMRVSSTTPLPREPSSASWLAVSVPYGVVALASPDGSAAAPGEALAAEPVSSSASAVAPATAARNRRDRPRSGGETPRRTRRGGVCAGSMRSFLVVRRPCRPVRPGGTVAPYRRRPSPGQLLPRGGRAAPRPARWWTRLRARLRRKTEETPRPARWWRVSAPGSAGGDGAARARTVSQVVGGQPVCQRGAGADRKLAHRRLQVLL